MDEAHAHYLRAFAWSQRFFSRWIPTLFNIRAEQVMVEGPIMLVPNHVTAWDPLLVAMSLKYKHVYFVASEHLFRRGFTTRVLENIAAPISRRRGTTGSDTALACMRHLKHGHSVCIFAEGATCFDGRTMPIIPATGKLARRSGATLVTYRIEGGYLSNPRWSSNIRRGAIYGHPVGVYPPEKLKTMTPDEINAAITRDIAENAWERQAVDPHRYYGTRRAEHLERVIYLCPKCRSIDSMRSRGNRFTCRCGHSVEFTTLGTFHPTQPFENLVQWEDWQREQLRARNFRHGNALFFDSGVRLSKIGTTHDMEILSLGAMELYEDRLVCAGLEFPLGEIRDLSVTRTTLLMFTFRDENYEISTRENSNVRKYYEIWAQYNEQE